MQRHHKLKIYRQKNKNYINGMLWVILALITTIKFRIFWVTNTELFKISISETFWHISICKISYFCTLLHKIARGKYSNSMLIRPWNKFRVTENECKIVQKLGQKCKNSPANLYNINLPQTSNNLAS